MITISELLINSTKLLRENNNASPRLDAEVMLGHLLNVERSYFIIHSDVLLEDKEVLKYKEMMFRRLQGEPIAYIIGHQEFMGLNFLINNHVLIPRPDTEKLVEYVIDYCKNMSDKILNILDIGTGSGAIALSIGKNIHDCTLTLVDISENALRVAKINAEKLKISSKVKFVLSDCFKEIENQKFDIIVSNPPYIPSHDIECLQTEVKTYEPRGALDGGKDGLLFYRRIIRDAKNFLVKDGLIGFEIGYNQGQEVSKLLRAGGYDNIQIIKDLGRHDRVVVGNLK
ncbi:peptide chain release factor N(5)-glutamine methyltransferase [Alkalibaculum sp. M08DMB]|uniref:Release factor glutamine methyltransferase n=1 Tax=Alkalibaculum sporogenes TaxID=2655001 RepID=A0A6A7K7M5_9FIRM|nr:peptide chain release factor N(5)-glutamine methyltransferase [Alkalibaculum sporogenes]MPW25396.1 peptide chain release factor N(5)-glutamine methyltransferase [Alkalibaculum sporogenes]